MRIEEELGTGRLISAVTVMQNDSIGIPTTAKWP
jgi:hypothetical protein